MEQTRENLYQARYFVEHKLLPEVLFKTRDAFINKISEQKEELVYAMMEDVCTKRGLSMPYKKEEYHFTGKKINDEYIFFTVVMPEAKYVLNCEKVYFVFNKDLSVLRYITIERSKGKEYVFGEWRESKDHLIHANYGVCPISEELEERMILGLIERELL